MHPPLRSFVLLQKKVDHWVALLNLPSCHDIDNKTKLLHECSFGRDATHVLGLPVYVHSLKIVRISRQKLDYVVSGIGKFYSNESILVPDSTETSEQLHPPPL